MRDVFKVLAVVGLLAVAATASSQTKVVPKGKQWEVLVYDGEWPAERLIDGPFASAGAAKAAAEADFAARGTA